MLPEPNLASMESHNAIKQNPRLIQNLGLSFPSRPRFLREGPCLSINSFPVCSTVIQNLVFLRRFPGANFRKRCCL